MSVLDHFRFHAGGQGEGGGAVAQVMQPDGGHSGGFDQGAEVAGEPVGGQWIAAEAGEDAAAVAVPGLVLLGVLAEAVAVPITSAPRRCWDHRQIWAPPLPAGATRVT